VRSTQSGFLQRLRASGRVVAAALFKQSAVRTTRAPQSALPSANGATAW
jgi:hypothetical protein